MHVEVLSIAFNFTSWMARKAAGCRGFNKNTEIHVTGYNMMTTYHKSLIM